MTRFKHNRNKKTNTYWASRRNKTTKEREKTSLNEIRRKQSRQTLRITTDKDKNYQHKTRQDKHVHTTIPYTINTTITSWNFPTIDKANDKTLKYKSKRKLKDFKKAYKISFEKKLQDHTIFSNSHSLTFYDFTIIFLSIFINISIL